MARIPTLLVALCVLHCLAALPQSNLERPGHNISINSPTLQSLVPQEAAESDHEFNSGSGIRLSELTPLQIENLATLGRVWGFLKYHHPAITAGKHNWDYDLFRIMPDVLRTRSRAKLNQVLAKWIDSLGPVNTCIPRASLDANGLTMKPDLGWIDDSSHLGASLSRRLQLIYRNRVPGQQFYVALMPDVGNPIFPHEPDYRDVALPDSGFQLLALFRLWNVIEYWYPNRDVVGDSWPGVLTEFIPPIARAADHNAFGRTLLQVAARIHDSHANFHVPPGLRPPVGACRLPVNLRIVDESAIVTGYTAGSVGQESGFEVGDEIIALDGVSIRELLDGWAPFYSASNNTIRLRTMKNLLTNGECGQMHAEVRRGNAEFAIHATRVQSSDAGMPFGDDLPGPTFRLLTRDVAYLKLSSAKAADVAHYIESAKGTHGMIVDLRNSPQEPFVFSLGSHLVRRPTAFAVSSHGDLANPGAFEVSSPIILNPSEPHYDGKVAILVDEETMSAAEFTAMALRSAPNAIVLGSTTAGADGNVSMIPLPGGMSTWISGIGIFYPDGAPTQRVGIHLDIEVRPTVAGIRAGRDEVLESAIHEIDPDIPTTEVQSLAHH
jgi:hypothetical protein